MEEAISSTRLDSERSAGAIRGDNCLFLLLCWWNRYLHQGLITPAGASESGLSCETHLSTYTFVST